ncbi:MAG: hypothetical protein LW721_08640 [Flammeovirgaceae bacterium]|jgi:O-antigen/teichoic acid export membrane protein|nr:hypothetical protein [Flammeovirgaceae bacterium]
MRTKNALLNLLIANAGKLLGIATYFYVTPKILHFIGAAEYGTYQLILQIVGYLNLVEFGVGVSLSLSIYSALAKKRFDLVNSYASGAQRFYSFLGIVLLILGSVLSFYFQDVFHLDQIRNANVVLLLFALNVSFSYFFGVPAIVLQATQKGYYIGWISIFLQPVISLLSLYAVYLGFSLLGVGVVTVLVNFFYYQIINFIISRKLPWLSVFTKLRDYTFLKGSAQYVFIDKILVLIVFQTDYLVISYFLDVSYIASYSIYVSLFMQITAVFSLLINVAQAGAGELVATGERSKVLSLWGELLSISFVLVILVVPGVIIFFDQFYTIWIGTEPLDRSILYVILANFVYLNTIIPTTLMVNTKNLFRKRVVGSVAELTINLIVSLLLVKKLGVLGVVIGTLLGHYLTNFWYLPYLLSSSLHVGIFTYFKQYGFNFTISFVAMICSAFVYYSSFTLISNCFLLLLIYSASFCVFLINERNRSIINRLLILKTIVFPNHGLTS